MKRLLLLGVLLVAAVPASAARLPIVASHDWWPVYAPDGRHVAFTRVNGRGTAFTLAVVDVRTRRVVTIGSARSQPSPTWSSDGRVAWSSGGVLYEANADGSAKRRYAAPTPAYAPAWRPHAEDLAYVTHHGAQNLDLWVGGALWAKAAIGKPAWSPDGTQLAFDREDGVYVTNGPGAERRVAAVSSPGGLAWSGDGTRVAYLARGALFVVAATGGAATVRAAHVPVTALAPSWSADDANVAADRAWSPAGADVWVASGPRPGCPGHDALLLDGRVPLTGTCAIVGTAGADVIYGTPLWGDVISGGAGNDLIHANDGHTDRVDCGPGRDTVWADRSDRLSGCEIVHR